MSKYTTELRYICENYAGLTESKGESDVDSVITSALPKLFSFSFPIFDEAYRVGLEKKIVYHYYLREIGFETVGVFKLRLRARLNEIMPYYNQLYESAKLEFNPLYDVDYTKSGSRSGTGKESGSTTGETNTVNTKTGNNKDTHSDTDFRAESDTPQGALSNINSETYLSFAEKKTSDGERDYSIDEKVIDDTTNSGSSNKNSESAEEYSETIKGKMGGGNYSEMLLKYRETFLSIDMMVIEELDNLFMIIW